MIWIVAIVAGYLLGSIPFGLLLTRAEIARADGADVAQPRGAKLTIEIPYAGGN